MADKTTTTTTPKTDTAAWQSAGRNVKFRTEGTMLLVAVDTSDRAFAGIKPTDKGNVTIASTLGNISVSETLKMGLNIYGKPPTPIAA